MPDWVLTRYDDVLAALKEPTLVQTGESGPVDAEEQLRARAEVLAALPAGKVDEWREAIAPRAQELLDRLPVDRPVDLVSEFIRPWCDAIAAAVMVENLKPLSKGLADTLPSFLGNALHDLIENPSEFARLRGATDAGPRAVEELLRHAGLVHTLIRTATADVELGDIRIATGDRVTLKLDAANRDTDRFSQPYRLDLTRKSGGHVALGAGAHSCAGAVVVRLATAVVLTALAGKFAALEPGGPVEWHNGSTTAWPTNLPVRLRLL